MQNNSKPRARKYLIPGAFLKWLPALVTGLILGFALAIFSNRR
jgi:hypothetical protein